MDNRQVEATAIITLGIVVTIIVCWIGDCSEKQQQLRSDCIRSGVPATQCEGISNNG